MGIREKHCQKVKEAVEDAFDAIKGFFKDKLIGQLLEKAKQMGKDVLEFGKKGARVIGRAAGDAGRWVVKGVRNVGDGIGNAAKGVVHFVRSF